MKRDHRGRFVRKPTTRAEKPPQVYLNSKQGTIVHEDWAAIPQLLVAGVFALFVGILVARCAVHGVPSALSVPARLSQDPGSRLPFP